MPTPLDHQADISKQRLENLSVNKNIILYSFPKSGRTWLRYLFASVFDEHLAAEHQIGKNWNGELILILFRDIRDTLVSYFYEVTLRPSKFGDIGSDKIALKDKWASSDQTLAAFIRIGTVEAILDFYLKALEFPSRQLSVSYEHMRADTFGWLSDFVISINQAFPNQNATKEKMLRAVESCSFENMRRIEKSGLGLRGSQKDGTWLPNLTPGTPKDTNSFKTRKGVVGGYSSDLSLENEAYIRNLANNHPVTAKLRRLIFAADYF